MDDPPNRVLFVFLDGVGLGEDDASINAFAAADLPNLQGLLGGFPLVQGSETKLGGDAPAQLTAADATLGLPGRPQSGTGQTALLTGANAPAIFGRHFGPWVPTALRDLLRRENILRKGLELGLRVAFANAYPAGYLTGSGKRPPRPAAPPLAAESAGALTRHEAELKRGRAVASSIVNDGWRRHLGARVPEVSARQAGQTLARIALEADLTLFAHYDTDLVGHRSDLGAAIAAAERVDEFLGGLAASLSPDTLLVIASDHGNLEDASTGHTRNPVPVIALGPGSASIAARVRDITHIAPAILDLLEGVRDT